MKNVYFKKLEAELGILYNRRASGPSAASY